jgi:hypothetical protein
MRLDARYKIYAAGEDAVEMPPPPNGLGVI